MFTKLMFIWYMATGVVVPQSDVDGRNTYAIFFENNTVIDYAYTGEVYSIKVNQTSEDDEEEDDN